MSFSTPILVALITFVLALSASADMIPEKSLCPCVCLVGDRPFRRSRIQCSRKEFSSNCTSYRCTRRNGRKGFTCCDVVVSPSASPSSSAAAVPSSTPTATPSATPSASPLGANKCPCRCLKGRRAERRATAVCGKERNAGCSVSRCGSGRRFQCCK